LSDCSLPTHCCIPYWTEGGRGNVTTNPAFVDADGPDDDPETLDDNDYRLAVGSPCIDAGDNSMLAPPGLDFDGNLRIAFGGKSLTVDMGAYEYKSSPFSVTEIIPDDRGGVQLLWNSQPNNTYVVWSCDDRSMSEWEKEEILFSYGAITWWTDPVTPQPMKVYRIEMK